ncbi:response regulator transcription factor [Pseudomonas sp. WS 5532]|uniref:response regulator transcription factor n=1 Tax=Pseudomonas TaxID=286 RepID=UPI0016434091|nr:MULTISPECIES: response regulator transcription factor [Pseudomonas]MCK3840322.1 response regulator transcription factor [Pseudomonas sp. NCIMB 10586]MCK3846743.1 response regulator transcription factor [Pseudomonas sp. W15Feb34]NMX72758.1 response regulator transcription factor [Pseudomonas sp. WS 5532]QXI56475.1 response regulator transcription factor [Pseudomonas sp. OE 28.3]VCU62942.1 LuxR family transcriptional regulator [Pseudomonas synxantha]
MGTIVIVDDHPLMRMAVRVMLEQEGHSIVAEVDNGVDAVEAIRKLLPDMIVLDLSIPRMDGLSVIAHLKAIGISTRVLILTSGDTRNFAMRSLQAGAAGFVCKDDNLDELVGAVKAVLSGYSYFPANTIHQLRDNTQAASEESLLIAQLSDREITVLKLLARGMGNQAIADELMINHKTVSTYKIRLQRKLSVENLIALGELAKRNGLA